MTNSQNHKLYGIIGGSLRFSLSPMIHSYLFKKYKLNSCYSVFESNQSNLKDIIGGIRSLNIYGVNVTYPYKEKIVPYLDKLDSASQKAVAVNTIINRHGKLCGYNTDIIGFQQTIQNRLKINIKNKSILLLGAGGAARACMVELIRQKAGNILVANRDVSKATKMIKNFKSNLDIKAIDIGHIDRQKLSGKCDLLINSTSADSSFVLNIIKALSNGKDFRNAKIFDMNYGLRSLPKINQEFPNRYVDGLYMLVAQAAASFNIWTGIKAEPDDIYNYMRRKLQDINYA